MAVGVGIVGLSANGGWAAMAHVPALRALPGYEIRALSASSAESARAAGEAHGVPLAFGSVDELVSRDEVDLVVVTVKTPRHHELVTAAVQANKMVLCEWPLGNGLAEAEELAALARSRGVRTAIGLQGRAVPAIRWLRDLIADGYVGDVLSTTVVGSGMAWGAEVPAPSSRYLFDAANGATMLTIPVAHAVDSLALVLGEFAEIRAVVANRRTTVRDGDGEIPMTAPDQVVVAGQLDSGAVATVHYRGGMCRGTNFQWEINGTDGDLVITGPFGNPQFAPLRIRGGHGSDTELADLQVPAEYHRVPGLVDGMPGYGVAHAYVQLLEDIENGTTTVPDFDHAVMRQRMVAAVQAAS
ncbi:Gfo/Idh/MocA family oxidoreductase [Kibdelosporangium philippinense]|uniref:Gfo/Idh/MocA family oxidoreductase n=1 Tax=Kibdelosporangium philippinense TaxID=211113 RepID=A0ABS8Z8M2_9PSEU|nr:Gfo/Idh/MocA family oxidoreductase [Kibdelosporangium philippinense]MCE7003026.1 Gfo/Idh/MocA family oxidoreductase [Kibdelosporangium philippinense]